MKTTQPDRTVIRTIVAILLLSACMPVIALGVLWCLDVLTLLDMGRMSLKRQGLYALVIYTLAATLLISVPLLAVLRRVRWLTPASTIAVGALVGCIPLLLVFSTGGNRLDVYFFYGGAIPAGAVHHLGLWFIALKDNPLWQQVG